MRRFYDGHVVYSKPSCYDVFFMQPLLLVPQYGVVNGTATTRIVVTPLTSSGNDISSQYGLSYLAGAKTGVVGVVATLAL